MCKVIFVPVYWVVFLHMFFRYIVFLFPPFLDHLEFSLFVDFVDPLAVSTRLFIFFLFILFLLAWTVFFIHINNLFSVVHGLLYFSTSTFLFQPLLFPPLHLTFISTTISTHQQHIKNISTTYQQPYQQPFIGRTWTTIFLYLYFPLPTTSFSSSPSNFLPWYRITKKRQLLGYNDRGIRIPEQVQ